MLLLKLLIRMKFANKNYDNIKIKKWKFKYLKNLHNLL